MANDGVYDRRQAAVPLPLPMDDASHHGEFLIILCAAVVIVCCCHRRLLPCAVIASLIVRHIPCAVVASLVRHIT